jgi:hypothetical protein
MADARVIGSAREVLEKLKPENKNLSPPYWNSGFHLRPMYELPGECDLIL